MAVYKMKALTGQESHKIDLGDLSEEELFCVLKEELPAVAETMNGVSDSNRETVIAFLRVISETLG